MAEVKDENSIHGRRRTDQQRLESWKAIANYLNRSVRTVRRWESKEQLPVYRHKHSKGATVYAYGAELDSWLLKNRTSEATPADIEPENPQATENENRPWFRSLAFGYLTASVVGLLAGYLLSTAQFEIRNAADVSVAAPESQVVLLAPQWQDAPPPIAGRLDRMYEQSISGLPGISLLPQYRIDETLQLMRLDVDAKMTPKVAREIALRHGGIDWIIVPYLAQLGDSIQLSVEVRDPKTDEVVALPGDSVEDVEQIPQALKRITSSLSVVFSQRSPAAGEVMLPQVTSSSMEALRLYARATELFLGDDPEVAEELSDSAIRLDRAFAAAYALNAWAQSKTGAVPESFLPVARAAVEAADSASASERSFVTGVYHLLSGNTNHAETSFRALIELVPDSVLAAQGLIESCRQAYENRSCAAHLQLSARLRPQHFDTNIEAAIALAQEQTGDATFFAERAMAIVRENPSAELAERAYLAYLFPLAVSWSEGNPDAVLGHADRLRNELSSVPDQSRDILIVGVVHIMSALGRIDDANEWLALVDDSVTRRAIRAELLFAAAQISELRTHLAAVKRSRESLLPFLAVVSGLEGESPDTRYVAFDGILSNRQQAVLKGVVAFRQGRIDAARAILEPTVAGLTPGDGSYYFIGMDVLAQVLDAQGDIFGAVALLENTAPKRYAAAFHGTGLFWLMCQKQLAVFYDKAGQDRNALRIRKDLSQLLHIADDGFPLAQWVGVEA